jgi:hypothetical protein
MIKPALVVHADWSIHEQKRWLCMATLIEDGQYVVQMPRPVGDIHTLLPRLKEKARGPFFLGVDFPLGLPLAYARQVGVTDFVALLPQLGRGKWGPFYEVAERKEEIGLYRPFYPFRPGGTSQAHLLEGLNVSHVNALRRRCDRARPGRKAAAPLFWTLGAQQVGKAAIVGWRDMLAPAHCDPRLDMALWPFSGKLAALLETRQIVVAETYPAECYLHLNIAFGPQQSKYRREDRAEKGKQLVSWAAKHTLLLSAALTTALQDGFATSKEGDDLFDAVAGLLGMINVLQGGRPAGEPADPEVRLTEGWILGQVE